MKKIAQWFRGRCRKTEWHPAVRIVDNVLQLYDGVEMKATVDLSTVKEVFAFKWDLFTYDVICIGLRIDDSGTYWEVDENFGGYEAFLEALPEKDFPELSGITDWENLPYDRINEDLIIRLEAYF